MPILDIATGAVGAGINRMEGDRREERQQERQKELMDLQFVNQKKLNEQGMNISEKLWNRTNYGAQRKHLEDANLSAGLMYGKGGAGGTTSGQSGGSASGGGASQAPVMDIAQQMLTKAQIENIKADTEKKKADANLTSETTAGTVQKLDAEIEELQKRKWLTSAQADLANARATELRNELEVVKDNWEEYEKSEIAKMNRNIIENVAKENNIALDNEKIRQIEHKIWQDWVNAGSGVLASGSFVAKGLKGLKTDKNE